jgi:hypothetical protein
VDTENFKRRNKHQNKTKVLVLKLNVGGNLVDVEFSYKQNYHVTNM